MFPDEDLGAFSSSPERSQGVFKVLDLFVDAADSIELLFDE